MKLRNLLYLAAGSLLLPSIAACSHEEIEPYSGPRNGIFIQQVAGTNMTTGLVSSYTDSMAYSLASYNASITEFPVRFYVRTIGGVTNYPRRYSLVIDEAATTAVEGVDFSLSRNDYIIYPGETMDTCIVTLIRTPTLRQKGLNVKLRLQPNENFDIIFDSYRNSGSWEIPADSLSAVSFAIWFSEQYNQPSYWSSIGHMYFGDFTVTKMLELEKAMGWSYADWNSGGWSTSQVQYGRMDFAAKVFQNHLQKLADAGTPVREDDGSLMQLPGSYAVDYSAYE